MDLPLVTVTEGVANDAGEQKVYEGELNGNALTGGLSGYDKIKLKNAN